MPDVRSTSAIGVYQSDIIVHGALVDALADLRANPHLLDYCFAGLAQDVPSRDRYGEGEIRRAKEWFLATEIPIIPWLSPDQAEWPCVSVALADSVEEDNTLADTHYDVAEDTPPDSRTELEGANFKETFSIGCHVTKDPTQLAWLHSIVKFCLLRYREAIETRGFERGTINSTVPKMDINPDGSERFYSRYINVIGHVRYVWPKRTALKITSTTVIEKLEAVGGAPAPDAITVITEIDPAVYDAFGNPLIVKG